MKRLALAATLALGLCGAAQATAIDLIPAQAAPAVIQFVPSVAVAPSSGGFTPLRMSELPEPEVFAMMLVGLVLIGYRAGRDSSEKFK